MAQKQKQKPTIPEDEYADLSHGRWYTMTQAGETLGLNRGQMTTLVKNGALHPKRSRLNKKVRLVSGEEVEAIRTQLNALREQSEHLAPVRAPQARYIRGLAVAPA